MNQNSRLAAWQNLLHKPVEVEPIKVVVEPILVAPVEPIVEEELPVQDVAEHVLDGTIAKPKLKKLKTAE